MHEVSRPQLSSYGQANTRILCMCAPNVCDWASIQIGHPMGARNAVPRRQRRKDIMAVWAEDQPLRPHLRIFATATCRRDALKADGGLGGAVRRRIMLPAKPRPRHLARRLVL